MPYGYEISGRTNTSSSVAAAFLLPLPSYPPEIGSLAWQKFNFCLYARILQSQGRRHQNCKLTASRRNMTCPPEAKESHQNATRPNKNSLCRATFGSLLLFLTCARGTHLPKMRLIPDFLRQKLFNARLANTNGTLDVQRAYKAWQKGIRPLPKQKKNILRFHSLSSPRISNLPAVLFPS